MSFSALFIKAHIHFIKLNVGNWCRSARKYSFWYVGLTCQFLYFVTGHRPVVMLVIDGYCRTNLIIAYIALINKWQVIKLPFKKTRKTVICWRIQSKGKI